MEGPLSQERLRLLIVDDDPFMREGLRLFFDSRGFEVLAAEDARQAWQCIETAAPEAVLVDLALPADIHAPPETAVGLDLVRRIKAAYPAIGVVILSAHEHYLDEVLALIRGGVRGLGYKLKGRRSANLLLALERVLAGHIEIDPEVRVARPGLVEEILRQLTPDERPWVEQALASFPSLTPQEARAAHLLAASNTTHGLARRLNILRADALITRVYNKLGLDNPTLAGMELRQVALLIKTCQIWDLQARSEG